MAALLGACTPSTTLLSPDGRNSVAFDAATMTYAVLRDGDTLIRPSALGIAAQERDFSGFRFGVVHRTSGDREWSQPWGENKTHRDRYNEMTVELHNSDDRTELCLRFRAYDDGVAFRYELSAPDSLTVTDELTEFRFADEETAMSWSIPGNFETYELQYREQPVAGVRDANTPFTFRSGKGAYGSVHEAALYDYPEMVLRRNAEGVLKADLAPLPNGVKAYIPGRFTTPWRTVQLGDKPVDLINSSLILNLNEPSKIADTSWIKPQKYVGVWWGMHLGTQVWTMGPRHGATTENALRHIDFAAANNIQGVLFEGWNQGWENWGGNQHFDYVEPYADFDLERIAAYAREKGVELWMHAETGGNIPEFEEQMERAFARYAELGVHTLKTGYAGGFKGGYLHHSQYGVQHYQRVVETAARYGIMLDVHEPIKETGIRRTWPNMMTREGPRHGVERLERGQLGRVPLDAAFRAAALGPDGLHPRHLRHRLLHGQGRQGTHRVERPQRPLLHQDHAGPADRQLGHHLFAAANGRRLHRELRGTPGFPVFPRLRRRLRPLGGLAGRDRRLYRFSTPRRRPLVPRRGHQRRGPDARTAALVPRRRGNLHGDHLCRRARFGPESRELPHRTAHRHLGRHARNCDGRPRRTGRNVHS